MKILQVHNRYQLKGGEDSVFQAEQKLLQENGHEVETFELDNKSIQTAADKLLTGFRAIYNFGTERKLKKLIRQFQPDIIHVHNFFPLVSPAVFYTAQKEGVPVVFTLHNFRLICPSAYLFHDGQIYEKSVDKFFPLDAVMRGVYRNSRLQTASLALMTSMHKLLGTWQMQVDKYIALSHFARRLYVQSALSLPEEKITIKPNFVEDFGEGKPDRENSFLYIGRLSEEKGIRVLLKSAVDAAYQLTILGDGPLKPEVEQAANENDNIHYLGFQERDFIINELKSCRALIFPSIWYECWPVTILEAFSTGTPVIASNLGSMKELVRHQENGLLFEAGHPSGLSKKIRELSNNPELAVKLGKAARQDYLEKYTPEANYKMLIGIYKELVEAKHNHVKSK